MMLFRMLFVWTVLSLAIHGPVSAHAQSVVQDFVLPAASLNVASGVDVVSFTANGFDSSLGDLTSVSFEFTGSLVKSGTLQGSSTGGGGGTPFTVNGDIFLVASPGGGTGGAPGSAFTLDLPISTSFTTNGTEPASIATLFNAAETGNDLDFDIVYNGSIAPGTTSFDFSGGSATVTYVYVPEPSSAALLALGALGIARRRRR